MSMPIQRVSARSPLLSLGLQMLRLRFVDYLLFIVLLLFKLVWFDIMINVPTIKFVTSDYLVAVGAILLISFWVAFLSPRWRMLVLILLNLAISVLVFADLVYYRYFQDFITVPVLMQANQVSSLGDSIESLLFWGDLLFFIDLLILLPLGFYWFFRSRRTSFHRGSQGPWWQLALIKLSVVIVLFTAGVSLVHFPIQRATQTWAQGLFVGNWWNVALYNVTGLLGFHGYDIYRYADEHWLSSPQLDESKAQEAKQWFEDNKQEQTATSDLFGKYKGSNVIVIQAEAFQNFFIGKSIGGVEVTPNINKLLKESMYFSNYYHQTGQGRTSDADFSSQCSLYPLPTGSVFIRYPSHDYDCLPKTLKSDGYDTAVFHAYDGSFWNRYNVYPNIGYNKFYSKPDFAIDEPLGWSLADESFFRQSVDKMMTMKQPFYSFLITLSSHHPYKLPESYQKLDIGDLKDTMFGDYLESVHYVDASLGKLIDRLKQEGLWDKTIFAFYGDHDNSIYDAELYSKFLGKPVTEFDMYKMRNQVPMIVHLPDGAKAGEYKQPAGQLDMAPSILHLLGVPTEDKYFMGHNMFSGDNHLIVLRNGSFTDGKLFYVPSADHQLQNGKCYDAVTGSTVEPSACKAGYEQTIKNLDVSDNIVVHDLISEFHKR